MRAHAPTPATSNSGGRRLIASGAIQLVILTVILLAVLYFWTKSQDTTRLQLTFRDNNLGLVLERRDKGATEFQYMFVLHPQDWLNTGIDIQAEDVLSFHASGRINIGLRRLVDATYRRRQLEDSIRSTNRGYIARNRASAGDVTPEEFYTDAQIAEVTPRYAWHDPDGLDMTVDASVPARTKYKIIPTARYGALVGLIRPTTLNDAPPTRGEFANAFVVGQESHFQAPKSGRLWVVVNDVWSDYVRGASPRMFYNDNTGSFVLRVDRKPHSPQ